MVEQEQEAQRRKLENEENSRRRVLEQEQETQRRKLEDEKASQRLAAEMEQQRLNEDVQVRPQLLNYFGHTDRSQHPSGPTPPMPGFTPINPETLVDTTETPSLNPTHDSSHAHNVTTNYLSVPPPPYSAIDPFPVIAPVDTILPDQLPHTDLEETVPPVTSDYTSMHDSPDTEQEPQQEESDGEVEPRETTVQNRSEWDRECTADYTLAQLTNGFRIDQQTPKFSAHGIEVLGSLNEKEKEHLIWIMK